LRLRWRGLRGLGAALAVAAVLGLGGHTILTQQVEGIVAARAGRVPSPGTTPGFWMTAEEMSAAMWLAANAAPEDVVATNVHCERVVTRPRCTTRSFWVSAISERRVVLEGWAYQDAVLAAHGRGGYIYAVQPTPDRKRLQANDAAFYKPTAEAVQQLRREYGARWLFADERAGPVSPDLARFAIARHRAGPVTVYGIP
jgi:hypothetical protein